MQQQLLPAVFLFLNRMSHFHFNCPTRFNHPANPCLSPATKRLCESFICWEQHGADSFLRLRPSLPPSLPSYFFLPNPLSCRFLDPTPTSDCMHPPGRQHTDHQRGQREKEAASAICPLHCTCTFPSRAAALNRNRRRTTTTVQGWAVGQLPANVHHC